MTVERVINELYAQNMEYRHQYDEIVKHFAEGQLKEAGAVQKDLQLHNVNIASYYTDSEIVKHFAEGRLKEAGAIQKDLQLHNVNIASYYTDKYALWLDFRTKDDNRLHGSGR